LKADVLQTTIQAEEEQNNTEELQINPSTELSTEYKSELNN